MRKILTIFISATLILSLAACYIIQAPPATPEPVKVSPALPPTPTPMPTPPPPIYEPTKIGLALPTQSLLYWNQTGDYMKTKFLKAGYTVDLQFADYKVEKQISQIEDMINAGCNILIITAIEADSLTEVLEQAKEKGIKVIAHDHFILNTDAVSYYVTFDNVMAGRLQGEYIRDALKLDTAEGPFNIELITGDPTTGAPINTASFFKGAMDVLNPYIESGKLVVQSGQTEFEQVTTQGWTTENAQARFDNLLKDFYSGGEKLDAVMASNDSTAQGATQALLAAGYTKENFPIITGMDCDITSLKNILENGTQSMSVLKKGSVLADITIEVVGAIAEGTEVPVNDTKTYDNGKGIVPSLLAEPVVLTKDNFDDFVIITWGVIGPPDGTPIYELFY